jgi:hypothetical protein
MCGISIESTPKYCEQSNENAALSGTKQLVTGRCFGHPPASCSFPLFVRMNPNGTLSAEDTGKGGHRRIQNSIVIVAYYRPRT